VKDPERIARIRDALNESQLDALICTLPRNVLLLSGYWPVIGASVALCTCDGRVFVLAPLDEEELAKSGWADEVRTIVPSSIEELRTVNQAVREPLRRACRDLGIDCARLGYELGGISEPVSYAAMYLYGGSLVPLLREVAPSAPLAPADELLARLSMVKTPLEVARIRAACQICAQAFSKGKRLLRPGVAEVEVAARFRTPLSTWDGREFQKDEGAALRIERADGFVWCMSGPSSAEAFRAYARSRGREIGRQEFILIHCNSYADGYWTDVTRTYVLGEPDSRQLRIYEAALSARAAALAVIRPGASAADVDRAARDELRARGFDKEFRHATGHGVGFDAISPESRPRLHPQSPDVLETGMVFNVEPAIYVPGSGGMRHCDVVTVTPTGAEVMTRFHDHLEDLIIRDAGSAEPKAA